MIEQKQDDQWEQLYLQAKKLEASHVNYDDIEKKLAKKTNSTEQITEIINQLKKIKYAKRYKSGLNKLALGSFFLVTGFLITCINFHSNNSFTLVMFSFTTIGLVFVFMGVYDIIG